jgi:hypothetical protein
MVRRLRNYYKGIGCGQIEVLSQHSPAKAEEILEEPH